MADAPQVLPGHQSSHLQHQQAMFKHTAQSPEPMSPYNEMAWSAQPGQREVKQPTILGMRRHNFWIILVMAFIIMAATIGGSVGGVLAVQNKKAEAQLAPTATSPATVNTVTIVSSVSAATPSASGSPYVPLSPAEVTRIDNSCGGLSSLQGYDGTQYACQEGEENDPASLTGLVAYTLQQCIDACSTYNYMVSNNTCQAAVLYWNLADKYRDNNGANCFLKPEGSTLSQGNATIARRRG